MENKIVMFSKPGCKYCENARSFLNTLQLQYKEIKLKPDEKNYEKAALEIQKTIDLNSEFKPALELQGETYIQLGLEKQSDELLTQALIYLKAAFRIDPKDDELKMLIQELEK